VPTISPTGIAADGTVPESQDRYSKAAVISFLHRYVGGIQLQDDHPAHRRFTVAPMPGGGLTSVEVTHDSPYGAIECSCRLSGGFQMERSVSAGHGGRRSAARPTMLGAGSGTAYLREVSK